MAQLVICPQGHEWIGEASATCPVCGATAEETEVPGMLAPADELPPMPLSGNGNATTNRPVPAGLAPRKRARLQAPSEPPDTPGYEILGLLGRGGMGVVYKARQVALNRVVALKMVLAAEHAGPEELGRFRAEAEAVAQLHHPNIVQIFEVDEIGERPFIALEYLDGGSLADKLAGTPLEARAAAQLAATLARAVHYAHGRGIVHRDLKPGNVLLSGDEGSSIGVPKITDFGLAKRMDAAGQTQTGRVMGTPSYMAPEQAAGQIKALGPACDIYALGAILYEMLTGRPPFLAATSMETLQQVLRDDPLPPTRLQPGAPFDLETICLKCLLKEPARRYASAQALAEDLERFLAGQPILARPVGRLERLVKWSRRRKALAALLAVSALAAAVLLGAFAWSYGEVNDALEQTRTAHAKATREGERAERNFGHARNAIRDLMRVAKDKLSHLPRMEQEQRAILLAAVEYFERLDSETDNPEVRRDLGEAYALMGDAEEAFGNYDQAETYLSRSLKIREEIAAAFPGEAEAQRELATSLNYMAGLYDAMGRYAASEELYRRSLKTRAELARKAPDNADHARELGNSHYNLALLLRVVARNDEAEKSLNEAVRIWDGLAKNHPRAPVHLLDLSGAHLTLGAVYQDTGRLLQAEKAYRQALAFKDQFKALDEDQAMRPFHRVEWGRLHARLGNVLKTQGKLAEAEKALREAADIARKLTEDYPTSPFFHKERDQRHASLKTLLAETVRSTAELDKEAMTHWKGLPDADASKSRGERADLMTIWANRLRVLGKPEEAAERYRQAVDLWQTLANDAPSIPRYFHDLANAKAELASILQQLHQTREAEITLGEVLKIRKKLSSAAPDVPDFALDVVATFVQLGGLHEQAGRRPQAEEAYQTALTLRQKAAKDFPGQVSHRVNIGHDLVRLAKALESQSKDAEPTYAEALTHFKRLAATFPDVAAHQSEAAALHGTLARLHENGKRFDEAESSYRAALALRLKLRALVPESLDARGLLGDAHFDLGYFLQKQDRHTDAETELTRARDVYAGLHAEFPEVMVYQRHYALVCNNLGNTLWKDRPDAAAKSFLQAQKLQTDLVDKHRGDVRDRHNLARYCHNLGLLRLNRQRLSVEAVEPLEAARGVLNELVKDYPGNIEYLIFLADVQGDLGRAFLLRDDVGQARWPLEESIARLKGALRTAPGNTRVVELLATQYRTLLQALAKRADHVAVKKHALELAETLPAGESHFVCAWWLASCIPWVRADGDWASAAQEKESEALAQKAVLALRRARDLGVPDLAAKIKGRPFAVLRDREDFKALSSEIIKGK